jgi:hypothetical protein
MTFWILSGVAAFYAFSLLWLGVEIWRAPLVNDELIFPPADS